MTTIRSSILCGVLCGIWLLASACSDDDTPAPDTMPNDTGPSKEGVVTFKDTGSPDTQAQDQSIPGDLPPSMEQGPLPDQAPAGDGPVADQAPIPPDLEPPVPDMAPECTQSSDCNDGLSCTTEVCNGGSCEYSVNANFCAIGGQCVPIDTVNSQDTCQKCLPTQSPWDWSNYVCTKTVAGTGVAGSTDGTTSIAQFYYPSGIDIGASGEIYIADQYTHRVRMIAGGQVTTLAGSTAGFSDNVAGLAQFNQPADVAVGLTGEVYVADYNNHRIRKIEGGVVTTFAGSGTAGHQDGLVASARFYHPWGLAVGSSGEVYVADQYTHRIRMIAGGQVSTLAGSGTAGHQDGAAANARFYHPTDVAVGPSGEIYVADRHNHRIRKIEGGMVSTLAGSGTAGFQNGATTTARFYYPADLAVGASGEVYVGDQYNHQIRKIEGGVVSTLAGSGTAGHQDSPNLVVHFHYPWGVATLGANTLYVGDRHNHRIRVITR